MQPLYHLTLSFYMWHLCCVWILPFQQHRQTIVVLLCCLFKCCFVKERGSKNKPKQSYYESKWRKDSSKYVIFLCSNLVLFCSWVTLWFDCSLSEQCVPALNYTQWKTLMHPNGSWSITLARISHQPRSHIHKHPRHISQCLLRVQYIRWLVQFANTSGVRDRAQQ